MGTRGVVKIVVNGKKYAFFIMFDAYYTGLGDALVKWLQSKFVDDNFLDDVKSYSVIEDDEAQKHVKPFIESYIECLNQRFIPHCEDDLNFATYGFDCEYVYTVDFDQKSLNMFNRNLLISHWFPFENLPSTNILKQMEELDYE